MRSSVLGHERYRFKLPDSKLTLELEDIVVDLCLAVRVDTVEVGWLTCGDMIGTGGEKRLRENRPFL